MNKRFLPKPFWDFYNLFPLFWDKKGDWESEESPSQGLSIWEDEKNVFVEASLPGIAADEIKLNFEAGCLLIEGEKQEEEKGRTYHKHASSSFYYRTTVPNIDNKKEPEATYKDGVLTVKFTKNDEKRKTIPIKKF